MVGPHFYRYGLVGQSRAIGEVVRLIELVSASCSTVLIRGETGTGKELVARAIHHRSARRSMPFINVNCAAIPRPCWNQTFSAM
jgi:transcriptional regulator with GAF, ATPase, and Fis domain